METDVRFPFPRVGLKSVLMEMSLAGEKILRKSRVTFRFILREIFSLSLGYSLSNFDEVKADSSDNGHHIGQTELNTFLPSSYVRVYRIREAQMNGSLFCSRSKSLCNFKGRNEDCDQNAFRDCKKKIVFGFEFYVKQRWLHLSMTFYF